MPIRPAPREGDTELPMRRLVLILLALGLVGSRGCLGARELPGDGTLVVDNARGR